MENQHRKISGYRELTPEEIDLMNRIKAAGAEMLKIQEELANKLRLQRSSKVMAAQHSDEGAMQEYARFTTAEPERWAAIGKTDIQTGIMALARAVAQPAGGV